MFGFLLGEALRDLRRAGRVAVSAIVLISLALAALGAFWLLSANLGQAVDQFRERVKIVVYLKREPAGADAAALVERVRRMPGVAGVRYVGKSEALGALKQVLGKDAAVADLLPQNPLPASLEITPTASGCCGSSGSASGRSWPPPPSSPWRRPPPSCSTRVARRWRSCGWSARPSTSCGCPC